MRICYNVGHNRTQTRRKSDCKSQSMYKLLLLFLSSFCQAQDSTFQIPHNKLLWCISNNLNKIKEYDTDVDVDNITPIFVGSRSASIWLLLPPRLTPHDGLRYIKQLIDKISNQSMRLLCSCCMLFLSPVHPATVDYVCGSESGSGSDRNDLVSAPRCDR